MVCVHVMNMILDTFYFSLTEEVIKNSKELNFDPLLFVPTRANDKAAGWDVRCALPEGIELLPNRYIKIPLGFRMYSPDGWWINLRICSTKAPVL